MLKKFGSKSSDIFVCETCDYKSSRYSQYVRHLSTAKHKNQHFVNICQHLSTKPETTVLRYFCDCGKAYKERSGLWRHKKKCELKSSEGSKIITSDAITSELVLELIKDNKEMKELIMIQNNTMNHVITNIATNVVSQGNVNSNNIIHNSNNKSFNLNFFLNETCKEAINISDFVSSIKLSLEDLEHTGRRGYIEGISNIILRNLKGLEQHQRPIHCNDQKREVLYIKEGGEWTKETEDKPILTNAIKVIANENIKQIKKWKDLNPDCTNSESKKNNMYLKIVSNSMNGLTEEEGIRNINKIISNVAKETLINKSI
jgi:hypothetical protein